MPSGRFLVTDAGDVVEPLVVSTTVGECQQWTIARTGQTIWPKTELPEPAATADERSDGAGRGWLPVTFVLVILAVASNAVWLLNQQPLVLLFGHS